MKNLIIAQSGGPTVAINASLAGVLKQNKISNTFGTIYGSLNGITGITNRKFLDLTKAVSEDEAFIDKLKNTPAMFLGSCRFRVPTEAENPQFYEDVFQVFEEKNVGAFFYIGGNDSMDTVDKLSAYAKSHNKDVQIIGIPKTIDNDLVHIDHTPGFGSAAKYVATSILEIAHDTYIYHLKSVTIVEIMGRDAGWLTAASALARNEYSKAPHLIYLPEKPFDLNQCISDTKKLLETTENVIIAVSEGIRDKDGNYISASEAKTDNFGHAMLSGAAKYLETVLHEKLGIKTRGIELNTLQRCASHIASETDLNESMNLGATAVSMYEKGETGVMINLTRTSSTPYEVTYGCHPVCEIANAVKSVPDDFINEEGNDVTDKMLEYLKPLIIGEADQHYKNGLPSYLNVSHLLEN
ncbi:MAG: 6-phosphofructokinase [Lachnospiraceae bacterium]|nr:6-phosphofructokinase [Lachnospiraceae bacterium]